MAPEGRKKLALLCVLEAALETLNLTSRIDQALLASEERMARRADVDVQTLLGRPRLPGVATATGDGGLFVFGVDASFHLCFEFLRYRVHADAFALLRCLFEPNLSVNQSEQRVV